MSFREDKTNYNKYLKSHEVLTIRQLLDKLDEMVVLDHLEVKEMDRRDNIKRTILYTIASLVREVEKLSKEVSRGTIRTQMPSSVSSSIPASKRSQQKRQLRRKK